MEQKGLHILIEAFFYVYKKHPNARLLLVGDGILRKTLEKQIYQLGLKDVIVITGFRSDVPKLLKIMDLFVMTSLWEGLSRSLAEAMYANLPIVATDVGGTSDAIRNDETGWLIPAGNINATIDAILDAMDNPQKANNFAANGYNWARSEFDIEVMNKRIENLYTGLIHENNF
jgi:glycosyltransferase involved in cell wall biosynthesis